VLFRRSRTTRAAALSSSSEKLMEPVLFYGTPHGCSFASIVALEWLGQPYRLARIDMLADPKDARYAVINPSHQTPALLLENGESLTESLAILHRIAARDPSLRLGAAQGTPAFDRFNEMLAFLHTDFHSAFGLVWAAYKYGDDAPEAEMLRRMGRDKTAEGYAHLDALLKRRTWLAGGDQKSMADAYFLAIARWGNDLKLFDIAREWPHVHAHMEKLEKDPAVVFAHAIEEGTPAVSAGGFLGHLRLDDVAPRLAA
jgi:glutathione S-transferase